MDKTAEQMKIENNYLAVITVNIPSVDAEYEIGVLTFSKDKPGNQYGHPDSRTPDEPGELEYDVLPPVNDLDDDECYWLPILDFDSLTDKDKAAVETAVESYFDALNEQSLIDAYQASF